jgi:hypothetical protein
VPNNYDRAIHPGGEGKISVKIDTKKRKGKLRKQVSVYTNDPENRKEILTITAFVKPIIDVEPSSVYLKGKEGETRSAEIVITGSEDRPLILKDKYFDLNDIVEYNLEIVEENRLYKVLIQNLPDKSGYFKGYLKLKTNYPEKPEISIVVRSRFHKIKR